MSAVDAVNLPPAIARRWSSARIAGHLIVALWIAAGTGLVLYLIGAWRQSLFDRWGMAYLSGLGTTLALVAISMIVGALLSVPLTYARMSGNKILSGLASAYVYFFRGTPLLAQTFLIYYGVGSFRPELETIGLWTFFRDAWYCAILAFSLNTAAYQTEILRSAIESIPKGQWEGAASLGLNKFLTLLKIILPQALIVALRPYGNELVLLIKASAIVAIITIPDLMGQTRLAYSSTFDFQVYLWAALVYLALVETLRHGIDWIERLITSHLHR